MAKKGLGYNTPNVFARLVGELWAEDPSKLPRGHEAMLVVQRHILGLPLEAGAPAALGTRKPGQSAQNQSTQGVFP